MTIDEARKAAYDRFLANWTGTAANLTTLEGEDFREPVKDDWVRFGVAHVGGGQETLGPKLGRKYRRNALAFVQIFTFAATPGGRKRGDLLGKEAIAIFEGESFSGLDFNNGLIQEGPNDGKWLTTRVTVQFDYEELK